MCSLGGLSWINRNRYSTYLLVLVGTNVETPWSFLWPPEQHPPQWDGRWGLKHICLLFKVGNTDLQSRLEALPVGLSAWEVGRCFPSQGHGTYCVDKGTALLPGPHTLQLPCWLAGTWGCQMSLSFPTPKSWKLPPWDRSCQASVPPALNSVSSQGCPSHLQA